MEYVCVVRYEGLSVISVIRVIWVISSLYNRLVGFGEGLSLASLSVVLLKWLCCRFVSGRGG